MAESFALPGITVGELFRESLRPLRPLRVMTADGRRCYEEHVDFTDLATL